MSIEKYQFEVTMAIPRVWTKFALPLLPHTQKYKEKFLAVLRKTECFYQDLQFLKKYVIWIQKVPLPPMK